jgi:hypothetical protein
MLCALTLNANAQVVEFWSENFGSGCNTGTLAQDYFSFVNGPWTLTETGDNADVANTWFISAAENGNAAGQCGSGCGSDPSLHIGVSNFPLESDLGATYYESLDGACNGFACGTTDKRIESGIIDCSIFTNNTISFNYIEGGNAIDNATLWFYDGADWSLLQDLPKTEICADGQGQWTNITIAFPPSANNNPSLRVAFRWQNNDDGDSTNPSFAVDDIRISGEYGEDAIPPAIICPEDVTVYTEDYCYFLSDFESLTVVDDNLDFFPTIVQSPTVETFLSHGEYSVVITATDYSGNSNSCSFNLTLIDDDAPVIECPPAIAVQAPYGSTSIEVTVPDPIATDNCEILTLTNSYNSSGPISALFPIGTTDVIFLASDAGGNLAECVVSVTVEVAPQDCCLGDLNCDGTVSVADMLILISQYGCVGAQCYADLDNDDIVGVTDLQLFNTLYGTDCPE